MRLHGHLDKGQLPERLKDLPDIVSGEVVVEITDIEPVIRDGGICIPFVAQHGFGSGRQAGNERARRRQGARSVERRIISYDVRPSAGRHTHPIIGAPGMEGMMVLVIFFSDSLKAIIIGNPMTIVPDRVRALETSSTEANSTYATLRNRQ